MHLRLLVLLAAFSLSSTVVAQEAPEATADPEAPEARRDRITELGVGPALVSWSTPPGVVDYRNLSGALALHHRNVYLLGGVFGFHWSNDVVFHDWKAMGDAYAWYFDDERPTNGSARALKFTALWPGLILIPFGGANYSSGGGLSFYFLPSFPTVYLDIGANATLFLRLSDPEMRADFAIGAHGSVGVDVTKRVGFSGRVLWGAPVIHSFIDGGARHVVTTSLNANLLF